MLSEQEKNVALAVSLGLTNREIASRLSLEEGTVRNYVSACLRKLELPNRASLAAWVLKNGLQQSAGHPIPDPDNYHDLIYGVYTR